MQDSLITSVIASIRTRAPRGGINAERLDYCDQRYGRILRKGRGELPILNPPSTAKRGKQKQHNAKDLHDRLCEYMREVLSFLCQYESCAWVEFSPPQTRSSRGCAQLILSPLGGNFEALMFFGRGDFQLAQSIGSALWSCPQLVGPYHDRKPEPEFQSIADFDGLG